MPRAVTKPSVLAVSALVLGFILFAAGCGGGSSGNGGPLVLTGFVTDAGVRNPIAGALISAQGHTATAGSNGFFTLEGVTGGTVSVTISAAAYQTVVLNVSLAGGSLAMGKVYLAPVHRSGTGSVRGHVTVSGAPAAAALVLIGAAQAQTDEAGQFALFNAPAGLQTLAAASADRAQIGYVQVTVPADGEVTGVNVALQGGPPPPPLQSIIDNR
jgi:hypothetical protein